MNEQHALQMQSESFPILILRVMQLLYLQISERSTILKTYLAEECNPIQSTLLSY